MTPVRIDELSFSRRDRKRFVEVEFRLNRHDPTWAPPLRYDRMKMMDPGRNPFFEHAEVAHFVAVRDGRDVGRVAAIRNQLHEKVHEEDVGFFGFFETEDDPGTANALLDTVDGWLRDRELSAVRGPVSYDTNGIVGALVGPFDRPPTFLMPHNGPHVPALLEAAGFGKAMDVLAWDIPNSEMTERIRRLSERLVKREGIEIRDFRMDRFQEEVDVVKELYNGAWEANWGFVPMTDAEFDFMAEDLKQVLDPDLIVFAYADGRPVGFALSLPDLNEILLGNRSGRLFPSGLFRILFLKKRIRRIRVLTLGILPEYRNRGIEVLFYAESFKRAKRGGYVGGECSWILETNEAMNRGIEVACGATLGHRYRVFERPLEAAARIS